MDGSGPAPSVFVSYAHVDQQVARRVVRYLTAHGVDAWLDERELRFGAELSAELRTQIDARDVVAVVASHASAASAWVGMELEYARERGRPLIPLLLEPVSTHERFKDWLGVDLTAPQAFAAGVQRLARGLYESAGVRPPAPDADTLESGLRQLAVEEPSLEPLISGCLDREGLDERNTDGVYSGDFHPLDEALNALYDLRPTDRIAFHAAYGFNRAGAGVLALSSWIATSGDGGLPLVTAVGSEGLGPALVNTAIELLRACDPPNEQALYNFMSKNGRELSPEQRRAVIRLVTWPVRPPRGLGDVVGAVAMEQFPESAEIHRMWARWINDGSFDGDPHGPRQLAVHLRIAQDESQPRWEPIEQALRDHVRGLLRSGDARQVELATRHVQAAADEGLPVLDVLLRETVGVSGTAEWNVWRDQEPAAAEWSGWYVLNVGKEARGERNWLRAREQADRMVGLERERRRRLSAGDTGSPVTSDDT